MLAQRLPSILPPLAPRELLEVSMIQSVAGLIADGALSIKDASGTEVASFPKGGWQAVGRMRVASEASDDD